MKKIKCKPDKNGVMLCDRECPFYVENLFTGQGHGFSQGESWCEHDNETGGDIAGGGTSKRVYAGEDVCYHKLVHQAAALAAFMEWNSGPDAGMEKSAEVWNSVVEQIIEAVT